MTDRQDSRPDRPPGAIRDLARHDRGAAIREALAAGCPIIEVRRRLKVTGQDIRNERARARREGPCPNSRPGR